MSLEGNDGLSPTARMACHLFTINSHDNNLIFPLRSSDGRNFTTDGNDLPDYSTRELGLCAGITPNEAFHGFRNETNLV